MHLQPLAHRRRRTTLTTPLDRHPPDRIDTDSGRSGGSPAAAPTHETGDPRRFRPTAGGCPSSGSGPARSVGIPISVARCDRRQPIPGRCHGCDFQQTRSAGYGKAATFQGISAHRRIHCRPNGIHDAIALVEPAGTATGQARRRLRQDPHRPADEHPPRSCSGSTRSTARRSRRNHPRCLCTGPRRDRGARPWRSLGPPRPHRIAGRPRPSPFDARIRP